MARQQRGVTCGEDRALGGWPVEEAGAGPGGGGPSGGGHGRPGAPAHLRHPEPIDPDLAPRGRAARPGWQRPSVLAAVAVGGVLGACAREELARTLPAAPGAFPVGTFAVNLSGSFALGLLLTLLVERWQAHELLRPLVATGVIGAYTTWSTFMVDVDTLVRDGQVGMAAGYAGASLVAGLAAVFAGMVIARSGLPGRVPSGLGAGRRGSRSRSSEKEEVGG